MTDTWLWMESFEFGDAGLSTRPASLKVKDSLSPSRANRHAGCEGVWRVCVCVCWGGGGVYM